MATKKKQSPAAKKKVGKVMHEFKHGELKSGSGKKVTNPKQAIAIGLSEARQAGANVPPPKKKSATKKTATKKGATKKGATKKATKKAARKKS